MKSATAGPGRGPTEPSALHRRFRLAERGSGPPTELRAGLTTFFVMSYIVVLNAVVITTGARIAGQDVPFSAIVTSTCLVAGLATLAMGLAANLPFALAPGMGINAFVAFQLMVTMGYTYAEAMGVILLEGVIITVLVLTGFRQTVLRALPTALKQAIGAGIGLFLFAIGAYEAGLFVVPLGATQGGTVAPPTAGGLGPLSSPPVLLAMGGLVCTMLLIQARAKGALLLGILLTTAVGLVLHQGFGLTLSNVPGKLEWPAQPLGAPDLRLVGIGLGGLSFLGKGGGALLLAGLLATLSVMLSDFFDTAGTFTALATEAGLADEQGHLRESEGPAFLVDSLAAALGGLFGSSSATTYIESGAGIAEGGRTGLTAVVCAIPFFAATVLANLFAVVPPEATAGALMIVGLLMLAAVGQEIPWRRFSEGLPALFTVMMMPLTWSITNGIGAGLILYVLLNARRATPTLWLVAAAFVVYFTFGLR